MTCRSAAARTTARPWRGRARAAQAHEYTDKERAFAAGVAEGCTRERQSAEGQREGGRLHPTIEGLRRLLQMLLGDDALLLDVGGTKESREGMHQLHRAVATALQHGRRRDVIQLSDRRRHPDALAQLKD